MFDFLVAVMIISTYIAVLFGPITLLVFRIVAVIQDRRNIKDALFIILIPLSIGYFLKMETETKRDAIYQVLVLVFFVFILIGSAFILFMRTGGFVL